MNILIFQVGTADTPPPSASLNSRVAEMLGYTYKYLMMEPKHYLEIHYKTAQLFFLHNLLQRTSEEIIVFLSLETFIDDPSILYTRIAQLKQSSKHGLFYRAENTHVHTDFFLIKNSPKTKSFIKTIALSAHTNKDYVNKSPYDAFYMSTFIKIHRDMFFTLGEDSERPYSTNTDILSKKLNMLDKPLESEPDFHRRGHIPKVFFQTAKTQPETHVRTLIEKQLSADWKYEFYSDADIINFFTTNQMEAEFPNIITKFNSLKNGAHKADLFRYYYLFVKGGVFMDSDAMIYKPIDSIVKTYGFFSVNSSSLPGSIFQGIIGSVPKNPIVYKALKHLYDLDPECLDSDYHFIVKTLYNILNETGIEYDYKFYQELRTTTGDKIIDDDDSILFIHYWNTKVIPNDVTIIPKNFIQTSKTPSRLSRKLDKQLTPLWKYTHFIDSTIVDFFNANPHQEFPNIVAKFYAIKNGAHRADLFRYYYIFLKGGVFLDSDAMIYIPIESILEDNSFVSVLSYHPESIFQGLIAAEASNPIIYQALKHVYSVAPEELDTDYMLLVKQLYKIVHEHKYDFKYKLLSELTENYEKEETAESTYAIILDGKRLVAKHFWKSKVVPDP